MGTGLELSPWHDRWAAGVFVEQHLVDHPGFDGLTFAGLYMTGQSGAWDTSSAVMLGKTAGAAAAWHYAARLRCDLGGGQKLGILAGVPLRAVMGGKGPRGTVAKRGRGCDNFAPGTA